MTEMTRAGPNPKDVTPCKACGKPIVFLQSVNKSTGKLSRMPVNVTPIDKKFRGPWANEVSYIYGQHESHWGTCSEPDRFRSNR